MARGLTAVITLVPAPAGFGKTTLIGEWRTQDDAHNFPLAWLALDDDDNEPLRFLMSCIAALATLKPWLGNTALTL